MLASEEMFLGEKTVKMVLFEREKRWIQKYTFKTLLTILKII